MDVVALLLLLLLLLFNVVVVVVTVVVVGCCCCYGRCCCTDLQTVSGVSQICTGCSQVNNPLAFEVDAHLQQVGSSDGSHKNGKFVCPLKLVKPIKKGMKS